MTEAEWKSGADPERMLDFLMGKGSNRKWRLLFCGYARLVKVETEPSSAPELASAWQPAVEVAERFAGNRADSQELANAWRTVHSARQVLESHIAQLHHEVEWRSTRALEVGDATGSKLIEELAQEATEKWRAARRHEHRLTAAWAALSPNEGLALASTSQILLREVRSSRIDTNLFLSLAGCVFGPLFWRRIERESSWDATTVQQLVRPIDEAQAFDRMPILADALEEAGCTNEAMLAHCRGEGPHVRGCWVVGLLLGKEQV